MPEIVTIPITITEFVDSTTNSAEMPAHTEVTQSIQKTSENETTLSALGQTVSANAQQLSTNTQQLSTNTQLAESNAQALEDNADAIADINELKPTSRKTLSFDGGLEGLTITENSADATLTNEYKTGDDAEHFSFAGHLDFLNYNGSALLGQMKEPTHPSGGNIGTGYSQIAGRWSFMTDAQAFELEPRSGSTYSAFIGGEYTTTSGTSATGTGRNLYSFSERKIRRVDVYTHSSNYGLISVRVKSSDSVWNPNDPQKKVAFVADSIGAGVSAGTGGFDWPSIMGREFGWYNMLNNSVGGTGFIADTSGNAYAFINRIPDLVSFGAERLIISGSLNDGGTPEADYRAAVTAYFTELFRVLPDIEVIALGQAGRVYDNGILYEGYYKEQIEAFNASNGTNILYVPSHLSDEGGIIKGSGRIGNEQGDGNADIYINTDNTHLPAAGSIYWANRMIEKMKRLGVTY